MPSQPQPGFIHLILLSQENPFYLEIPTAIVATVCLSPRKYLRYLGWCVLGVIGVLNDEQGNEIVLDGELVDQGVYQYVVPDQNILAHAVDLEVIKQRSQVPSESETTQTYEDFRTRLLERDGCCVWTGWKGMGMYIIPYRRGDEWLQRIIDNRPHDEDVDSLTINDIENGIYGTDTLHNHFFDPRDVVVLKTPNPILQTTDIPERFQRDMHPDVSYPANSRYTLQWIVTPKWEVILSLIPNNNDATFMNQEPHKPADVLLHYNYGAAAVKKWGKNTSVLTNRPDIPRPSVPVPAAMGTISVEDRRTAIQKRAAAMSQGGQGAGSEGSTGDQDKWDEDDVMLFFWGNSKAAMERHARKEQERTEYLEDWRAGVTGNQDE